MNQFIGMSNNNFDDQLKESSTYSILHMKVIIMGRTAKTAVSRSFVKTEKYLSLAWETTDSL